MIFGPQVRFTVQVDPLLDSIERIVPGAEVMGWNGRRWQRLRKFDRSITQLGHIQTWAVFVALHSAWRAQEELGPLVLNAEMSPDCAEVFPTVYTDHHRAWLEENGRRFLEAAVARGELAQHFLDIAAPYQVQAAAWGASRRSTMLFWRVGSGKTAGALSVIVARAERRIVVLCPAAARKEWRTDRLALERTRRRPSSVERFTGLDTHVLMPEGQRKEGDETLEQYRARMQTAGRREILVVGMESCRSHIAAIEAFQPEALYIDEFHKLGDPDRWSVIAGEDGMSKKPVVRETDNGAHTLSVTAMELSRLPSIRYRCGLSGTPLDDGRPRRIWAPLDLVSPGGFGSWSTFRERYCGYFVDPATGFGNDKGSTHMDELKRRVAGIAFDVPRSESHAAMAKQIRVEVDYFTREQAGKPAAMKREIKALTKEAAGSKASASQARARLREALLAEAASMKYPLIKPRLIDFVKAGEKVLLFFDRHALVDAWAEELRGLEAFKDTLILTAHGGMGPAKCDEAVERYDMHQGSAVLLGTWSSIGESKNGMQRSALCIPAQLPVNPTAWQQGIGRVDRIDGVGTLIWVPVIEGSQDDHEVARITRKFGAIEKFIQSPELRELGAQLDGTADGADELINNMVAGMKLGSEGDDE